MREAEATVQAGLALNPKFTTRGLRAGSPTAGEAFNANRERMFEAMRLAGAPDG